MYCIKFFTAVSEGPNAPLCEQMMQYSSALHSPLSSSPSLNLLGLRPLHSEHASQRERVGQHGQRPRGRRGGGDLLHPPGVSGLDLTISGSWEWTRRGSSQHQPPGPQWACVLSWCNQTALQTHKTHTNATHGLNRWLVTWIQDHFEIDEIQIDLWVSIDYFPN